MSDESPEKEVLWQANSTATRFGQFSQFEVLVITMIRSVPERVKVALGVLRGEQALETIEHR